MCPTILRLLDEPVPPGLDGRALDEALVGTASERPAAAVAVPETVDYTPAASAEVAGRLRDLGYLE